MSGQAAEVLEEIDDLTGKGKRRTKGNKCGSCGFAAQEGDKFCQSCGGALTEAWPNR
jgi:lipopolysaccharide biosynthesis regulator YciM